MPQKLPFFKTVFGCYFLLIDNLKSFAILGCAFGLFLTALSFAGGQESLCLSSSYRVDHFCTSSLALFLLVRALILMTAFIFARCWYQWILLKQTPRQKKELFPSFVDIKLFGLLLAYLAAISIAVFSAYLLYVRQPNPNWKIELSYFTFVSLGFLFPVFGLRFFAYVAYIIEKVSLPTPRFLWKNTSGGMLPIISAICLLLIIMLTFFQSATRLTMGVKDISLFATVLNEFLTNLVFLFVICCFINYCYIQKKFFDEQEA